MRASFDLSPLPANDRASLGSRRLLSRDLAGPLDNVARAATRLVIDAADIFANDSERDQLGRTEEKAEQP